jgi:hypothetical protein
MTSRKEKLKRYYYNIDDRDEKFGWERTEEDENQCCDIFWIFRKIIYYVF